MFFWSVGDTGFFPLVSWVTTSNIITMSQIQHNSSHQRETHRIPCHGGFVSKCKCIHTTEYYTVIFLKLLIRNDLHNVLLSAKTKVHNTMCIVLVMWKGGKECLYVYSYYLSKTLQETDSIGYLLQGDLYAQGTGQKENSQALYFRVSTVWVYYLLTIKF